MDGIHPHCSIFESTVSEATSKKENLYASAQETVRKNVERSFGLLISRWALLTKPFMLLERERAANVMKCAIILDNMVIEGR